VLLRWGYHIYMVGVWYCQPGQGKYLQHHHPSGTNLDLQSEINWRIPMALQGLPCIIVLVFVWFLPESPRWLMSQGRESEAHAVITK